MPSSHLNWSSDECCHWEGITCDRAGRSPIYHWPLKASNSIISGGLGMCSKLCIFRAGHNNLFGVLPDDIYNATKIEEISLFQNSLNGISESIANVTNLNILNFNFNQLSGMLPRSVGKLSKLELLLLQFNHLNSSFPSSLMNCTNLSELVLNYNRLTGVISKLNFSKLSQLTILDLGNNFLSGIIPTSICETNLQSSSHYYICSATT
ncbi:putative non-specific serine/threonine protein kinase [Rosa chinensis]|uniref:Putative non-specific serine/threonine protein kinase n=1 Tax=Rosa chinensis TaxID=74649 RepID=A0A2P6QKB5_ROSCH|nr:putative non-specific serine/threonine protein kinase [Rosa chinensis]